MHFTSKNVFFGPYCSKRRISINDIFSIILMTQFPCSPKGHIDEIVDAAAEDEAEVADDPQEVDPVGVGTVEVTLRIGK